MIETEILQAPTCATGLDPNCGECCAIFSNAATRAAFGYQAETAACSCHEIETTLSNYKSENKYENKSFWDNFHF